MEIANCLVALGGDAGNTVPKYGITPAEIAALRAIHGDESVFDIEPKGTIDISNRAELNRLRGIYGKAMDSNQNSILGQLYPGAAARVFETLEELDLDESFYKAIRYMPARSTKAAPPAPAPVKKKTATDIMPSGLTGKAKKEWEAKEKARLKAEQEAAEEEDDNNDGVLSDDDAGDNTPPLEDKDEDGIEDMDDEKGGVLN